MEALSRPEINVSQINEVLLIYTLCPYTPEEKRLSELFGRFWIFQMPKNANANNIILPANAVMTVSQ